MINVWVFWSAGEPLTKSMPFSSDVQHVSMMLCPYSTSRPVVAQSCLIHVRTRRLVRVPLHALVPRPLSQQGRWFALWIDNFCLLLLFVVNG